MPVAVAATPMVVTRQLGPRQSLPEFLGWRTIQGRVLQVDGAHLGYPDFNWWGLAIKTLVLGLAVYLFGQVVLFAVAGLALLAWLIAQLLPKGLVTGVAVQVISFMLTRRLMGPMATMPIKDVRVRENSGRDVLVRFQGQMVGGSVAAGDEVTIEGWMRQGTLICRRGFNKRINAAIRLKR